MHRIKQWADEGKLGDVRFLIFTQTAVWSFMAGILFMQTPLYTVAPVFWVNLMTVLCALAWIYIILLIPFTIIYGGQAIICDITGKERPPSRIRDGIFNLISERLFFTLITCAMGIIAFTSSASVYFR